MLDFFFFLKTLFLTFLIVLMLQIEIGHKTVENHVHDWMAGSIAAGFLGNAAHGGAHFLKDATFKMTQKMREHIGLMHKDESHETKSSHFHWGWQKAKDSDIDNAPENHSVLNERDAD
jgi:hypothetical protein